MMCNVSKLAYHVEMKNPTGTLVKGYESNRLWAIMQKGCFVSLSHRRLHSSTYLFSGVAPHFLFQDNISGCRRDGNVLEV